MAKVPNAVEILPKISTAWVGRTNVTDRRQTDRQTTDGRAIAYSEREREFTFAKNQWILIEFALLDLEMNTTCDGMNFTDLT